jgi:ketosteroid isomerase-like protein
MVSCTPGSRGRFVVKLYGMGEDKAADFVRRFTEFWQAPAPERLDTVLASNARLSAPMVPTTYGLEAGKQVFADLFELITDMSVEVHRWGATSDGVLIEFTVRGTAGGSRISWESVDRFVLDEDGLAIERFTYFDSLPLVLALALRPRVWPAFTRSRIRQMRR